MYAERNIDKTRNTIRIYMKYYAKGARRNMPSCKVRFKFLGHSQCSTVIWDTLVFMVVLVVMVPIMETCYVFPVGKTNPCLSQVCQFGAECVSSMDGSTARCQCPLECYDYGDSYGSTPICASNGKDYKNVCEVRKESCQTMSEIKIKKYGRCDPCENVTCEVHQVCSLSEDRKPICICEKCDNIVSPVCGSDGHTYSNECMLRQQACQTKKDITVLYDGRCKVSNPCVELNCGANQDCMVDRWGQATCICPSQCQPEYKPVCGSDGVSYKNECELRRQACLNLAQTSVAHPGPCDQPAMDTGPCKSVTCQFDAQCVVKNGKAVCECPTCNDLYDPVCGDNGISYENNCKRLEENCREKKLTRVEHRGLCMGDGCDKNSSICQYYSTCVLRNGLARCVCPSNCSQVISKVCGTDGVTYDNECQFREASCTKQIHILMSFGACEDCNGIQCQYGSNCIKRQCVCPEFCPKTRQLVCANDSNTYDSECHMHMASCHHNTNLIVVRNGECVEEIEYGSEQISEGSENMDCGKTSCQFGGMCYMDSYGNNSCVCSFRCEAIRSPVCGSDGVTYGNRCELQTAACRLQKPIIVQSMGNCDDMDEILCNGMSPILTAVTGQAYTCYNGQDCPSGSYCHLQFAKCCNEDQCQCHSLGSVGNTCDPATKQCQCKHGIGGLKCDRCLPGYWGLQLIQDKNDIGCTSCSCHHIGSSRIDCHQMTGRCICKDGYEGHKCNRCKEGVVRKIGCDGDVLTLGPTDVPLTTRPRKTTRHIHASNYMTHMTPKRPKSTLKPPMNGNHHKFERIGELCLEDSFCSIPNSHCHLALCQCIDGYIPTYENTQCSKVREVPYETVTSIPEEINTCTLNPCLNSGICKLDDSLGYRCLCKLGRTGTICKQSTSFTVPSFSGSSYLMLQPLGNISRDFYVDIVFRTMNKDGILLYSSQNADGTGHFLSIAISNGHVEFRYDTGSGPVQVIHPYQLSQEKYHQVIAKKLDQNSMLIVDGKDPVAAVTITRVASIDLSGSLYIGSVPQNLSFIQEKIGVNLGFVGCVKSFTSKQDNLARTYNLDYPRPVTQILDGIDIGPCERNPCQNLPCVNGGTCMMLNSELYKCLCPKDYTGTNCDGTRSVCPNSPCHPSSTCVLTGLGEALCQCPDSREGQFCEYERIAEIVTPEFHGDSYLILPIVNNLSQHTTIEVWLLAKKRNGVILFASQYLGEDGDFISLNIDNLYVELRFDLGDSKVIVRSTHQLSLDLWHKVTVRRVQKDADLIIDDGAPNRGTSQGSLTELQLSGSIYIGGYKYRSDIPKDSKITENFTGIIQRIYINGRLIENPTDIALEKMHVTKFLGPPCVMNPCMNGGVCVPKLERAECKCPKQFIGQLCEKIVENLEANFPVKFDGSTYLQFLNEITSRVPAQKLNKFQFRFRTRQPSGLIVYQGQASGVLVDYIAIAISNGYVELGYNLGKQNKVNLLRAQSSVYVCDGEWHTVYIERDMQIGKLQVDKEKLVTAVSAPGAKQLDTDGILWIGGGQNLPENLPSEYYTGFNGCLGDMFVQDKELNLYTYNNGLRNTVEYCH